MKYNKKLIRFPGPPEPQIWTFFDYIEASGTNPIENWYQELSGEGKAMFNALLKNTHKIKNHLEWGGFKYMKGNPSQEHIWQLDFIADRRQYRLLGVFGRVRKQAIVVLGCYHKGDVYSPHNSLDTACKRARALREGKAGTPRERKIENDL